MCAHGLAAAGEHEAQESFSEAGKLRLAADDENDGPMSVLAWRRCIVDQAGLVLLYPEHGPISGSDFVEIEGSSDKNSGDSSSVQPQTQAAEEQPQPDAPAVQGFFSKFAGEVALVE